LSEVHRRVLECAAQRNLKRERASALADAVVTKLALGASGDSGASTDGTESSAGPGGPAKG